MRRLVALLTLLLLLAAACGDDDGGDDGAGTATATSDIAAVSVEGEVGQAPVVNFPHPFAVDKTVNRVLVEGDGEEITEGASVGFHYVALNGRDGNLFDSSYEVGPVSTVLDRRQVLPGLVDGLLGTKAGGRVVVAVSPDDGFGPVGGAPESGIEADDTIVFVIDVQEIRHPLARAEGTPVEPVAGLPTVALDAEGKPTITMPGGDPPAQLVSQPLIEGSGATVEAGQTISVHYTGVIWASGTQFDSSWDRGTPASFPIGTGNVIVGWDEGLVGQKVGSQVLLVIPPDKGYGSNGDASAGISGTDTLVFVVDILDTY
jgi:peptidylprolyl isomerase